MGFGVQPDFRAKLIQSADSCRRKLVGSSLADGRIVFDIHQHHPGLMDKARPLVVRSDIGPVDIQNVDSVFRHTDLAQHLVERILCHPQEVRILLHEQAFINISEALLVHTVKHVVIEVVVSRAALFRQLDKCPNGFLTAGNGLFHSLDKRLYAARKAKIKMLPASRRSDAAIQIRHQAPVNIQSVLLHQELAGHSPIARIAE